MPNGHDRPADAGERIFASPLARRMAKQAGIDLSAREGLGAERAHRARRYRGRAAGRREAAGAPRPQAAAAPVQAPAPRPAAPAPQITAPHRLVPNSTMRKVIARRLSEAKATIPHFYLTMDMEIDALLKLRADLNAKSRSEGPGAFKLSVNDLVIKAAAITLRRMPKVNASYTEDNIVLYDDVDISVAVVDPGRADHADHPQGRPEGPRRDQQRDEGARRRARSAGKLKPEEFQGGGFSISNLGMYGVREFAAVINPPQGAILAVGAGEQRAGGEGRRARGRHDDDLHALGRSPRGRWRARRGMARRLQVGDRGPAEPDALRRGMATGLVLRDATPADVRAASLRFVRALAEYERMLDEAVGDGGGFRREPVRRAAARRMR